MNRYLKGCLLLLFAGAPAHCFSQVEQDGRKLGPPQGGVSSPAPEKTAANLVSALEVRNGMPVLLINGRPTAPVMLWGSTAEAIQKTARLSHNRGIRLYTTCINLPWPRPGEPYDFGPVDAEMEALRRIDPDILYMPRIGVVPPDWWRKENPDELPVWENGRIERDDVSVASEKWLTEACRHIDALVRHMEAKWGRHIFAYHPAAMNSGEWYYTSTIWSYADWGLRHFERPFQKAYQRWLANRYGEIAKLNLAWRTKYARFDDIDIPPAAERKATRHGLLRNPHAERSVVDFTTFQSQAITDAIKRVTRAFRDASGGKKLIYVFYGYTYELAGLQEGIANFGHLNFEGAMDDRIADVWCAPMGYYDRRNGGSGPIMGPAESAGCRGQAWCNEDDLRTHLTPPNAGWGRVHTPDETLWCHRRDFMASMVHRSQIWFMEQNLGWLTDDAVWRNIAVLQNLYSETCVNPAPFQSDVAVIVDEKSMMQVAYGVEIGLPLLYDIRAQINRMGTTPELWLLSDYIEGRVTGKKLVVFLNAFSLTDRQRQIVREKLKAEAATALWFYAPGILTPDAADAPSAFGVRGVEALTGIKATIRDGERAPAMRLIRDHKYAKGVAPDTLIVPDDILRDWQTRDEAFQFRQMTFPPRKKLFPLLAIDDRNAEPFGHYADRSDVAMAVKEVGGFNTDSPSNVRRHFAINRRQSTCLKGKGYKSILIGGLTLPALVLANIAADAGVHLYCPAGDVIYTDGRFLSVTACQPGVKTITLPHPAVVSDVFTDATVANGVTFTVDLKLGETRVYRLKH